MNNILKKVVAVVTTVTCAAWMVAPVSAATTAELQTMINDLLAQIAVLQAQISGVEGGVAYTGCTITSFDRNLKVGMSGDDVKCLQVILNADSETVVAESGVGSAGNETTYFGSLTNGGVVKFQDKYAAEVLAQWGLTAGTGYVGSSTREKLNSMLAAGVVDPVDPVDPTDPEEEPEEEPAVGEGLTVAFASDNPASGTLVQSQGLAELAKYRITNGDSETVKVTKLVLKRIGVSADATLSNVYLFEGAERLTDSASVSAGNITFVNSAGIISLAAGESRTVAVLATVADETSGQTVGVSINASSDIVTEASSINGTFPMSGNLMSIASADLATVVFSSITPTDTTITAQDDFMSWQARVAVGIRTVSFSRLSLEEIGSINYPDLENFRLHVDGTLVSTVANLETNGYVTFDLSGSPVELKSGNRTLKVLADVIGGANRDFSLSLRDACDASFVDSQYGVIVLPTGTIPAESGPISINQGSLSITKMTDSPSGTVVKSSSGILMAKYEIKANGEDVKIEYLNAEAAISSTNTEAYLRDGKLMANGVQVGSTADLLASGDGTSYSLGSSLVVSPGSPVVLEVYADTYDEGDVELEAGSTITISLQLLSSKARGVTSQQAVAVIDEVDANQLTVGTGTATLAKYAAYTDNSLVVPLTAYKLGHFTLTGNSTEAVNVDTITVEFGVTDEVGVVADISNAYVVYGSEQTTVKPTLNADGDSWSVSYELAKNASINVEVYADVAVGAYDDEITPDTIYASTTIAGLSKDSGATLSTTAQGQTFTFTDGVVTQSLDGSSPVEQIVTGNQTVTASIYKFTSLYELITLTDFKVGVTTTYANQLVGSVILKDGTEVLGTLPLASTYANFTGLNVEIPANSDKSLTVDLVLALPDAQASSSGVSVKTTLVSFKYNDAGGVPKTGTVTEADGKEIYVYKTLPTVSKNVLTGSIANGAAMDLYSFNVAADAKGNVGLQKITFGLAWSDSGDSASSSIGTFLLYRGGNKISNVTVPTTVTSTGTELSIVFNTEERIGAGTSLTYKLKATPDNFDGAMSTQSADTLSIYLKDDDSHVTSATSGAVDAEMFVWSDQSELGHSLTTTDWTGGYLVTDLPLGAQTWSR